MAHKRVTLAEKIFWICMVIIVYGGWIIAAKIIYN